MARKVVKELQEQFQVETLAHQQTVKAFNKRLENEAQAEMKIQ